MQYFYPDTPPTELQEAGLAAREARDLFMLTVSHYGLGSDEAIAALAEWGKADKAARETQKGNNDVRISLA